MIDLSRVLLHNGATAEVGPPLTVTTGPEQWSYAAAFSLDTAFEQNTQHTGIRLNLRIVDGAIGVLAVANDLTTVLSSSVHTSAGFQGPADLLFDEHPVSGWLILRNNAAGQFSRAVVNSIETFEPEPNPKVSSGLAPWVDLPKHAPDRSRELFDLLRKKWGEVPAGLSTRMRTNELLKLSDDDLVRFWNQAKTEASTGNGFKARGWYHAIYSDVLRGKRVMDIGSGLGIDGLTFAKAGARMTFVDIAENNLVVLQRLSSLFGLTDVDFLYLEDFSSLDKLPRDFDVIWCQGSMINAPFDFMRRESALLLRHLPVGGRWIELCYPEERWQREGSMPFSKWGEMTDGEGTPWMEWYDLERLLERLEPAIFEPVITFNFHNDDFNWFDLLRCR